METCLEDFNLPELLGIAYALNKRTRTKLNKKQHWVHPLNTLRIEEGEFHAMYGQLRYDPDRFFKYYRMSMTSFDELVLLLRPSLKKKTLCRLPIGVEERLTVTLRYLATGLYFQTMSFTFRIAKQTIRVIVKETCKIIWNILQPIEMAPPTLEEWKNIANEFLQKTNFPNCVGVVDAKHIRMRNPFNSRSKSSKSKQFYSVVLSAIVDAEYRFIAIDVGSYGREGDSAVFKESPLGKILFGEERNTPPRGFLPNTTENEMPFVFLGDQAFGLHEHLLRPFPRRDLTMTKRVFNYRLKRARRYSECAFGILSNKWRVFHSIMLVEPDFATSITKAACVLHNFIRSRDGYDFADTLSHCFYEDKKLNISKGSYTLAANDIRQKYVEYFMSPIGEVPWQYRSAPK